MTEGPSLLSDGAARVPDLGDRRLLAVRVSTIHGQIDPATLHLRRKTTRLRWSQGVRRVGISGPRTAAFEGVRAGTECDVPKSGRGFGASGRSRLPARAPLLRGSARPKITARAGPVLAG